MTVSRSAIEDTARDLIDDVFDATDERLSRVEVLKILSEVVIARLASEEGDPEDTARDIVRFVAPLLEGRYPLF